MTSSIPWFESDRLIEDVRRQTGVEVSLPRHVGDALTVLASSAAARIDEPVGRRIFHGDVMRALRQRALWQELDQEQPIDDEPFEDLVFIIGLPRTGSTLLHNFFAADPASQIVPLWRAVWPFERQSISKTMQQCADQLKLIDRVSPDLRRLHPMSIAGPEECITLMGLTFVSQRYQLMADIPEYGEWLDEDADVDAAYLEYRAILRRLVGSRGRVVVKAPAHLRYLSSCVAAFPEARFVWLHRPLSEILPSFCALVEATQKLGGGTKNTSTLGPFWSRYWAQAIEDGALVASTLPVSHIQFADMIDAPVRVVSTLYDEFGWGVNKRFRASAAAWFRSNALEHKSAVAASPRSFGLRPQ